MFVLLRHTVFCLPWTREDCVQIHYIQLVFLIVVIIILEGKIRAWGTTKLTGF